MGASSMPSFQSSSGSGVRCDTFTVPLAIFCLQRYCWLCLTCVACSSVANTGGWHEDSGKKKQFALAI